jgi:DNA polymerase III alpha subunit (gram-positive type)
MTSDLLRFKRDQNYIVFDAETEGLNLVYSRPWQCSWVVCRGNRIISSHDHFIAWDDLQVSPDAARVTGFDKSLYERRAEDAERVFELLFQHLYDPSFLIIGQNILGFDVYMINIWRKLIGLRSDYSFMDRVIDTKSLSTAIFKDILPDKSNFLSWQYKMLHIRERGLKTNQAFMLKHYDIPHDPKMLHNSLYDVEMTFEIFKKQIYNIEI